MKEQKSIQPRKARPTILVDNYEVESTLMYLSEYYMMKNLPKTPGAPAILMFKGLPHELAEKVEKLIMQALSSQAEYDKLIAT